jgi:tetratricopeptide (TPR) repeat protein
MIMLLSMAVLIWTGTSFLQGVFAPVSNMKPSPLTLQPTNKSLNLSQLESHAVEEGLALSDEYTALLLELKTQIAEEPGKGEAYYRLGLLYAARDPELALAYLQQGAILSPQYEAASRRLQETIATTRLRDEPAYTFLDTGRVLASLGEWAMAAEAFKQAAIARPDYAEAWAFLGEAYQQLPLENTMGHDPERTKEILQRALNLNPRSVSANILMGLYWKRAGRLDAAVAYLTIAAEVDPNNPAIQTELGSCMAEMGDLPAAQAFYIKAVELAPKDSTYWRLLAEYTLVHGQVREVGLHAARQAVYHSPTDPRSLHTLGLVFYRLEDLNNAEKYFKRALDQNFGFAPSHLSLAVTYLMMGRTVAARQHLDLARQSAPGTEIEERVQRLTQQYFP